VKTVVTTRCSGAGHPEFRFKVDETAVIDPDVDFFRDALETWVLEGERFKDGETVQYGWSMLTVRRTEDGHLSLWEPDFQSLPIQWVDSVTATLEHLRVQKDVCESYFDSVALAIPSLQSSCIVCVRLQGSEVVVLDRAEPEGADSGWFIGCLQRDHDHDAVSELHKVSVYEGVLQNPRAMPFLGMPPGTLIKAGGLPPTNVFYEGEERTPKPSSYLDALAKRPR
jgi:hypothetical protein